VNAVVGPLPLNLQADKMLGTAMEPAMDRTKESPLAVYQAHLDKGELAYQWSPQANKAVFYPRVICPFTGSDRLEWRVSTGLGTVYATTVTHPREGAPYNVALIDCDEGFRLMSRVGDIPPEAVKIGMRVKFRVHRPGGDEPAYPVFVPVVPTLPFPASGGVLGRGSMESA
jgi:uncharacterized protein